MAKKNIFVMALDQFNLELLKTIRHAEDYRFPSLLDYHDLIRREQYPMARLREDDFESLRGEVVSARGLRRGSWKVGTVTRTVLTSTSDAFHIHADLDAYLNGDRVFCKTWNLSVPRDHV